MLQEYVKKLMKPILKEVYAEGYNAGQEDTSRRMFAMYKMGQAKGYVDGYTDAGAIDIEETDNLEGYDNAVD